MCSRGIGCFRDAPTLKWHRALPSKNPVNSPYLLGLNPGSNKQLVKPQSCSPLAVCLQTLCVARALNASGKLKLWNSIKFRQLKIPGILSILVCFRDVPTLIWHKVSPAKNPRNSCQFQYASGMLQLWNGIKFCLLKISGILSIPVCFDKILLQRSSLSNFKVEVDWSFDWERCVCEFLGNKALFNSKFGASLKPWMPCRTKQYQEKRPVTYNIAVWQFELTTFSSN